MAIKCNFININNNIFIENAYIKISYSHITKERIFSVIHIYLNEQERIDGNPPVNELVFPIPNSENIFNIANVWALTYEYIKTLPEFAESLDC